MRVFSLRLKDLVNPKRWKAFLRHLSLKYLFNETTTENTSENLDVLKRQVNYYKQYREPYIIEQLFVRLQQCSTCVQQGYCSHCGCDIPDKLLDLQDYCSELEEKILPKEEWELIRVKKIKECLN